MKITNKNKEFYPSEFRKYETLNLGYLIVYPTSGIRSIPRHEKYVAMKLMISILRLNPTPSTNYVGKSVSEQVCHHRLFNT